MSDSDQLNADLPKASIRDAFLRSLRTLDGLPAVAVQPQP